MSNRSFHTETLPGILLLATGLFAMFISNSTFADSYFAFINSQHPVNVLFIVNDVLMTIFFLDVGLEIKHQIVIGHLSKPRQIYLPLFAASGGVIAPALIYYFCNSAEPAALHGWAIPTATDIAFALGVILLLGRRIPLELKVLLLAIAVLDDLLAIIIIACFYTSDLNYAFLGFALAAFAILVLINYAGVKNIVHYLMLGTLLWYCMLESGVHPTISGVLTALAIPLSTRQNIHNHLYVWVSFVILPVFALVNAGISLADISLHSLFEPITYGIALGLMLGKQLGVFSFSWLAVKLKIASLPKSISWYQMYGMALLCGIGFTMSIFIGNLAFSNDAHYLSMNKLGVIIGSTVSAIIGYTFLWVLDDESQGKQQIS